MGDAMPPSRGGARPPSCGGFDHHPLVGCTSRCNRLRQWGVASQPAEGEQKSYQKTRKKDLFLGVDIPIYKYIMRV